MKDKKIRVALVGCGRISRNHIKSILEFNKEMDLVALCDDVQEKINSAKEIIKKFCEDRKYIPSEIIEFTKYKDLISSIKNKEIYADLIVLATPSGLHSEQTIMAANIGVDICTEKPMATNWKDALLMLETCKKAKVQLFVVKQNRFNSTLQLLKKQITEGRFGKMSMVSINVFWQRPQEYYDQANWRGTLDLDGGALMNQASHYVDLLDWLIGPVESICAFTATIARNIEAEDTATLQIKWKSGTLGSMAVTMLAYPRNLEGSITLLGEKGSVKIGGKAVNKIELWEFEDESPDDLEIEKANYETESIYGFGHPIYYKNMIETIQGKSSALCNGDEGLKSMEILIAAYTSAKEERIVKLPLEKNF